MANNAVSNTGPIIHLSEINLLTVLSIFQTIIIPEEVAVELRKNKISPPRKIKILKIMPESKDTVKILTNQHNLDLGEAEAITLTLQEKSELFLTDDLDAREVAKEFHIEVHGTLGIILRAFRNKLINKKIAILKIKELKTKSSLFITQDLINRAINAINDYKIY